jgi:hypothetical protein
LRADASQLLVDAALAAETEVYVQPSITFLYPAEGLVPARIYDLRSTFASNALAAGVTVFELARVMGTSVRMIEKHYRTLFEGAHAGIASRLAALGPS